MKKLLILLLLTLSIVKLSAEETIPNVSGESATLNIKAYKVGSSNSLKIYIVSAVPGAIGELEFPETTAVPAIDITNMMDTLFGDTTVGSPNQSEHIVFSYRVYGQTGGNYTITLNFSEFMNNQVSSGLGASYSLANTNYIFNETGNSTETIGDTTYQIKETSNSSNSSYSFAPTSLSASWSVTEAPPAWIVRGAVAMTIDEASYDSAAYGLHTATVTVTLTTGE